MKLGYIEVEIESIGGNRFFFARPLGNINSRFNQIVGICHVVHVEKNKLSSSFKVGNIYKFYGIFIKSISQEQFDRSFCNVVVTPITKGSFLSLKPFIENKKDIEHAFKVE
jgi:hypothetical protein